MDKKTNIHREKKENGGMNKLEKLIRKACKPVMGMPVALSGGIDSGLLASIIKPKFVINVELPGGERYNESEIARRVARHLGLTIHVIRLSDHDFKTEVKKAIKIIGEPVPHFNVFPLYIMYKVLAEFFEEKEIVIADGPDESMCGYTRHLIMNYLYSGFRVKGFKHYLGMLRKFLPLSEIAYSKLSGLSEKAVKEIFMTQQFNNGDLLDCMCAVDMKLKRPEMALMDKLAEHFGITIHRPYETKEVDEYMFNLPPEMKIHDTQYGKYALRLIAEKYLPEEIAWRKQKVGGPVYPVNQEMGWVKTDGEFGKGSWLKFQKEVLG